MRALSIILFILLFTGGAVLVSAEPVEEPETDWTAKFNKMASRGAEIVANARTELERAAERKNAERAGCLNVDGTIDGICMDNQTSGAQSQNVQGGMNIVNKAADMWQDGKDYTSQVAGKISDKVSASVNAKIDPQLQKMRDVRDQVVSLWTWIKWSVIFITTLFTIYVLEPYVSLINNILGLMGLRKRKDVLQEKLEELTRKIEVIDARTYGTREILKSALLPSGHVGPQ